MKPRFHLLAFLSVLLLAACTNPPDNQVVFNPTVEMDDICAGLLNNTFQTTTVVQEVEIAGETRLAPLTLSFLLDGRLIWNYENNQSYIGTFECEQGRVTGAFEEGSRPGFEGSYSPEAGTVDVDGVIYLVVREL